MSRDERFMRRALELARLGEGRTRPNPAVGAVIVCDGEVVGEGYHPQAGEPHAEIFALRQAGEKARGAELFVTLEPCSHHGRTGPCAEAVLAAGIRRVCIGTVDPNPQVAGRGIARLQACGVEVCAGVLEAECRRLIAPFAKHITTGLPFVVLKSAMTLDGRTATVTGDSRWITGSESRAWVHQLRDRMDAVMVGIGTLLRDDPLLTTRLPEGGRDAARIVVDSGLRIPESAAILRVESAAPTIIATTHAAPAEKIARLEARGAQILVIAAGEGGVDLRDLLRQLGASGIQSILLEGGNILNAAALRAGLIDRVMIFIAPLLLGSGEAPGIFAGRGAERLVDALKLTAVQVRRFGDDTLIEGEVHECSPA
jgi:diaminohydroxyphosphoribosylaminopyrimidine deaminase/5-amino-6-(5-phosphoribosylamino)uracil reductase